MNNYDINIDKLQEEINILLNKLSKYISRIKIVNDTSNIEIKDVTELYVTIGTTDYFIDLIEENKINFEFKNRYDLLITEFKDVYHGNKSGMERLLHYALNDLRTEYDNLTESYIYSPNDSLNSVQDFDDFYLGLRDKIEYIFHAIKILDLNNDFLWLDRIKRKINCVDTDLQIILSDIYRKFKKEDIQCIWEPEKSMKFWWRKLEYEIYLEFLQ